MLMLKFLRILKSAQNLTTTAGGPAMGVIQARCASKKASGGKRNLGGNSRGKNLGVRRPEGSYVQAGMIIVRQKMKFKWYPGSYVKTGRDKTLSAQVAGSVYFTRERWHPKTDKPFRRTPPSDLPDHVMMRTFVHIRPELEIGAFTLKEQI